MSMTLQLDPSADDGFDAAGTVGRTDQVDANADPIGDTGQVRNDADLTARGLQVVQGRERRVQGLGV